MLKRFVDMVRSELTLSLEVRLQLINGLFYPFSSLLAGALAGLWIAATVSFLVTDVWVKSIADLILIVALLRILIGYRYVSKSKATSERGMRRWESAYAVGAGSFSLLLGLVSLLAILRVNSEPLHLMLTTTTAAYAASITGRNAGRPWVALSQLYLAAGPMCLGLIMHPTTFYQMVGYALLIFMFGMTDITVSVRATLVGALETKLVNLGLAKKAQQQAALFDDALNNMSHGLCMFDAQGTLLVWNQKLLDILKHDGLMIEKGMNLQEILKIAGRNSQHGRRNAKLVDAIRHGTRAKTSVKSFVLLQDDTTIAVSRQIMQNGNVVIVFEDVTEQTKAQDRIKQLAWTDELTGLMNRASFKELLGKYLEGPASTSRLALHLIDLDNFKAVNDSLGHPIGDELLVEVSKRIVKISDQNNFVARLGGDEFVVVQPLAGQKGEVSDLAGSIITALREPFEISGHRINIGASIGVALAPQHATVGDVLLKRADMALYEAKANGRGTSVIFEENLDTQIQQRRQLELDIRTAIAEEQFSLSFQPIVSLESGNIVAMETLIRWRHPVRGYVSPAEFIPIAEETGLIISIGRWVLEQACKQAVTWDSDAVLSVNFSAVQFQDRRFLEFLVKTLAVTGLPAHRLELEVTETAFLSESTTNRDVLSQFRDIGVGVSLDDFGTGFSSLSHLRAFPFTKIKIDGSFVRDLGRNPSSVAVIRAVCNIGQILGIAVVAECVESEEQLQFLLSAGCSHVQGYLLGRPAPAAEIAGVLAQYSPATLRNYLAA